MGLPDDPREPSPARFDVSVWPWDLRARRRGKLNDAMAFHILPWHCLACHCAGSFFSQPAPALCLQPLFQARRRATMRQPPVTAVMPIKLEHSGFDKAQTSVFDQDYPEYEVLFSAAEADSPALETALALKVDYPQVPTRILRSQSDFAVSPKLNTLDAPLSASAHDFVLVKDSNIVMEHDTLATFMRNFRARRRHGRRRAGCRTGANRRRPYRIRRDQCACAVCCSPPRCSRLRLWRRQSDAVPAQRSRQGGRHRCR